MWGCPGTHGGFISQPVKTKHLYSTIPLLTYYPKPWFSEDKVKIFEPWCHCFKFTLDIPKNHQAHLFWDWMIFHNFLTLPAPPCRMLRLPQCSESINRGQTWQDPPVAFCQTQQPCYKAQKSYWRQNISEEHFLCQRRLYPYILSDRCWFTNRIQLDSLLPEGLSLRTTQSTHHLKSQFITILYADIPTYKCCFFYILPVKSPT